MGGIVMRWQQAEQAALQLHREHSCAASGRPRFDWLQVVEAARAEGRLDWLLRASSVACTDLGRQDAELAAMVGVPRLLCTVAALLFQVGRGGWGGAHACVDSLLCPCTGGKWAEWPTLPATPPPPAVQSPAGAGSINASWRRLQHAAAQVSECLAHAPGLAPGLAAGDDGLLALLVQMGCGKVDSTATGQQQVGFEAHRLCGACGNDLSCRPPSACCIHTTALFPSRLVATLTPACQRNPHALP